MAIVDTETFDYDLVTIGGTGTIAGHQWTSPNGHFTFAAFEGPGAGVAVIDHEQNNAVVQTSTTPAGPTDSTSSTAARADSTSNTKGRGRI